MSEVAFELLLGRTVVDAEGRKVGRIEEAVAEKRGDEWVVTEFHAGPAALLERLAARLLGSRPRGVRIPWDRLDLSDPERPVVTGDPSDLSRLRTGG